MPVFSKEEVFVMKSVLLIGLGRFGRHVALKLGELRHQVMAVDLNEERVNEVLPYVTGAQIGDSTHEQFIASLGVRNFELCIVAIGADAVVYPEKQMASWAAVRYSADHIFDYIELTDDYSIYETGVPSDWIGRSIIDLRVRQQYQINILAVKQGSRLDPLPPTDHVFARGEKILVMGSNKSLSRFLRLSERG